MIQVKYYTLGVKQQSLTPVFFNLIIIRCILQELSFSYRKVQRPSVRPYVVNFLNSQLFQIPCMPRYQTNQNCPSTCPEKVLYHFEEIRNQIWLPLPSIGRGIFDSPESLHVKSADSSKMFFQQFSRSGVAFQSYSKSSRCGVVGIYHRKHERGPQWVMCLESATLFARLKIYFVNFGTELVATITFFVLTQLFIFVQWQSKPSFLSSFDIVKPAHAVTCIIWLPFCCSVIENFL